MRNQGGLKRSNTYARGFGTGLDLSVVRFEV